MFDQQSHQLQVAVERCEVQRCKRVFPLGLLVDPGAELQTLLQSPFLVIFLSGLVLSLFERGHLEHILDEQVTGTVEALEGC